MGYVDTRHNERAPLHPKISMCVVWDSRHKGPFEAAVSNNTEQPLATLLHRLKSLELLKSLWGADEGNSSIEYISIGIEREIFGTL